MIIHKNNKEMDQIFRRAGSLKQAKQLQEN